MKKPSDETLQSIVRMIIGALSFSVMATFVKAASGGLPSTEVVFYRSLLGTIAIAVIMARRDISFLGKNPLINSLRGVSGFIALQLHFYCIKHLDLGTAVMLNYTAPIFVVILAHLLLKERTRGSVMLAIGLSFLGVYLLASPQFDLKPIPVMLGMLSGVFAAIAYVLIRFSKKDESPYTIIFYFTGISTLASLPLLPFGYTAPTSFEWFLLFGVAGGAFFGQIFLTKAIQGAPVSTVMPFGYLTPVFAALFGFIIWQEHFTTEAIIGSFIIIACGVSIYLLREKPSFIPLEE